MTHTPQSNSSGTKLHPGRDANGRFVKGNPGGPGNPFARKVAVLRSALINFVTVDDMKHVAFILKEKAMGGDLAAIKLLFQYCLGKPGETVDPDRLDIEEAKLQDEHYAAIGEPARLAEMYAGAAVDAAAEEDEEDADDELDDGEDEPAAEGEDGRHPETGSAMARLAYRLGQIIAGSAGVRPAQPPSANGPDGAGPEDAPSPDGGNGRHLDRGRGRPAANG
jgi:hypothetical protein